ncbi:MAG: hypothetical protein QF410_12000 [Planctomycetota bacterium]|nr:hypothetical protein [Planctomycetota bacterium]MDP6761898.1 hypothetical protein [Planctomycetota bacterium]
MEKRISSPGSRTFLLRTLCTTAALSLATFAHADDLASDGFDSGDLTGGSGRWGADWEAAGTSGGTALVGGAGGGQGQVTRLKNDARLTRNVNTSGCTDLALSFSAMVLNYEAGDETYVQVGSDSTGYTTVHTLTAGDSDGAFHEYAIDLADFGGAVDMKVRFLSQTDSGSGSDYCFVDDIVVSGTPGVGEIPVAAAGEDGNVYLGDEGDVATVTLDGSGSSDSEGAISTYSWMEDGSEIAAGETADVDLALGHHELTLVVTDADGNQALDDVTVTINPGTLAGDSFETADLTHGWGSWAGPWSTLNGVKMGRPAIHGWRAARMRGTNSLGRIATVPGARDVRLTFWARVISYEEGDVCNLKFRADEGAYTTLHSFDIHNSDGAWHYYDFDLSDVEFADGIEILFASMTEGDSTNPDMIVIDAVKIVGR